METESWKTCGISIKFPSYRNSKLITTEGWLVGKRKDDGTGNFWRIHDDIYDFTNFIDKHPGGSFWLSETKGMDITELFEAHHISKVPFDMIKKYKVGCAERPRIYTLTFGYNGFYNTLKNRVREKLKSVRGSQKLTSDVIHLALLVGFFAIAVASVKFKSLILLLLAGTMLSWTTIAAHNYFHKRDNWRMYTFNLSMMNFYSWRISHAMSHHMFPNSFLDLELSMFEPFLCWIPNPFIKGMNMRYLSIITEPFLYGVMFFLQMLTRIIYSLLYSNIMFWHDCIPLTIPLTIYVLCGCTLSTALLQWVFITIIASFAFCLIGLNAAHHDPKIYHEGDATRSDRDWGLFQVDTIIDRSDLKGSQFLTLTHFGDHILHHLFPTLDHGILPCLYPELYETLYEFKGQLRECTYLEHFIGQHKQLLRTIKNKVPPGNN